jgi:cytochrome c peroxidase
VNQTLAAQGKTIFDRATLNGGCGECHGITPGTTRFFEQKTWHTPIQDVGTDSREYDVLTRTVQTGVLKGAQIPFLTDPLKKTDTAFNVLRTSVVGSILQHYVPVLTAAESLAKAQGLKSPFRPETEDLKGAFALQAPAAGATPTFGYESRVLEGIWATAPYLHNGSVPTLAELLKPPAERVGAFGIGPAYDPVNVGLAVEQPKFNYVLKTTDCSERNSGNSRCGHDFGTALSADEKRALLEYLKTL